jgi:multimeric flavodoxin WrbA
MRIRKFNEPKKKILIFQGSSRDKDTCPNMSSKTHSVIEHVVGEWGHIFDIEVIDLSVNQKKRPIVQPCKGCVSTAGGYHCHWHCISHDQRVHTKSGFVKIEDIKVGDILQDGNVVLQHIKTSESEIIYELKINDGRRIHLTKDHRIKIIKNGEEIWAPLNDVEVGDRIPQIDTNNPNRLKNKNIEYNDFLIYGMFLARLDDIENSIFPIMRNEYEFLNNLENILGEKIISIHNLENRDRTKTDSSGIKFDTQNKNIQEIFNISNFLENFKNEGDIFNFLNGWISATRKNPIDDVNQCLSIEFNNYYILREIQLLLTRVDIKSIISKEEGTHFLQIVDKKSIRIIQDYINFINPSIKKQIPNLGSSDVDHGYDDVKMDFLVESIEEIGTSRVYDIEVSNSHEFNCEGVKVHNCSCYFKGNETQPDLLKEFDVYSKLENCDAFAIFAPIHWHALPTQVKSLFDRLVCCNLTLTTDDAKKIMGEGNTKNSEITGKFSKSGKYDEMLRNHLEGKACAFFVHGDDGANEYSDREFPDSYSDVFDDGFGGNPKNTIMPYIMQMKYSGIYVPDNLIEAFYINRDIDYYTANTTLDSRFEMFQRADKLMKNILEFLEEGED